MAATEPSRALLALTSAALALPGVRANAALPAANPSATAQYGFYQENDQRMRVEIYHADLVLPISDRVEFSFGLDRDTYSGATPAFSIPRAMADQLKFRQHDDGSPAADLSLADVVSAASQGVTAGQLTILGGLNAFKDFVDARAAAEAQFLAANPRPASPPPPPTLPGPVTLDFEQLVFASHSGAANLAPVAGGACPGNAAFGCYLEDGMAVGIVADSSNPVAHLHRTGPVGDRALGYHADSSGIFIRALDGSAFNLDALDFAAPLSGANPDAGADDVWEILGFNTATDPALDLGDGTNYPARVALQTVANGFNGTLALDPAFQNIRSFWIHYRGYPQTPTDGKDFEMRLDDVRLSGVAASTAETPEQIAWAAQLEREVSIAQFQAVLDKVVPVGEPPVQRFQQQPRESRTQPVFSARYFWDQTTLALTGGVSDEPDFESNFGSFNVSRELNDRLTTVSLGYGYTHNSITRNGPAHSYTEDEAHAHGAAEYPELDEQSHFHNLNVGLGQVLGKHQLLQVSAGYTHQRGYLSNPYKFVYVRGEITAAEYYALWQAGDDDIDWQAITPLEVVGIELFRERRPELRQQWSTSARLNHHLPALDASLQADYRFYVDDWGITSHTVGVEWYQTIAAGLEVTPFIRYYTQSRADFFAPYFLAPRADGFYSSDFRLSGFGALSTGVSFRKTLGAALSLRAGVEYYTHEGALKAGGGGAGDYADFSNVLAHAALEIDLSAARTAGGAHHHSPHALAATPAGVQYAHGLRAGEFMVGYRYMDMRQAGALQAGTHRLADALARDQACGAVACRARPTDMTMRMHMLEAMAAPTDWLTLMLMPQILDAEMTSQPLPGAPAAEHHVGEHTSDGLGDTTVAALLRVFERRDQRVQLGLAFSAPTGESAATMDGLPATDSSLHDFGMQRGSGTWDARPTLTYGGWRERWSWGAQVGAVLRLEERNAAGYALGDGWHATGWGGYRVSPWLTGTVRGLFTAQGNVRGDFDAPQDREAPVDLSVNTGGRTWDLGLGVRVAPPGGTFAGHALSVEWLQPLATDFNGVQLERDGALQATWSLSF